VGRDKGDSGRGIFENRGSFLCQILSAQRMEGKKSLIVKENRRRRTSQILFLPPSQNRFSKIPASFSFSTPSLTASFLVSSSGEFRIFANLPPGKAGKGDLRKNRSSFPPLSPPSEILKNPCTVGIFPKEIPFRKFQAKSTPPFEAQKGVSQPFRSSLCNPCTGNSTALCLRFS